MAETIPAIRLEQAAQLLGRGTAQVEVAEATGISASYLNELLHTNKNFQLLVNKYVNKNPAALEIDNLLDQLELENLRSIRDNIHAYNKPHLALGLARTLNAAKRRSEGEGKQDPNVQVNVITLELPEFIADRFSPKDIKKNDQNEVIEIGGHSMITASASSLVDEAQEHLNKSAETVNNQLEVSPSLPDPDFQREKVVFEKDDGDIDLSDLGEDFEL